MTNKLVVIVNSLKVPKIKKILLYEMKFLVPNYRCLQNPWLGGYRPQLPVLSVLNWICWTRPPNKIPGYATDPNDIWCRVQFIKLNVSCFPASCQFPPSHPQISPSAPYSPTRSAYVNPYPNQVGYFFVHVNPYVLVTFFVQGYTVHQLNQMLYCPTNALRYINI